MHEVITDIDKATTLLLQSNSIQDIHGWYVKLEKKHDLSYKVELSWLIAQNPFTRFNKEIILSKKSSHMITRVKHAKKLWEKYTELEHLRSELLSPFSYASNFQRTRIESIVSQYFSQVWNMQLLSYWPEETQYETFEESITNYDTYLKQEARHIKKISRWREQVQKHLNDTIRSRENVQKYTYRPFDSLEKNIPRLILLQERTWPFWSIRQELIKRLEKTYTEQYEYLIRSSWVWWSNRGRSWQASWWEIVWDFIQLLWRSWWSRRSWGRWWSFGGWGWGWSSWWWMSFWWWGRSGSWWTSW